MIALIPCFITIRLIDVIDIILVAALFYQIYRLIKGTAAINIFLGIFAIFLLWRLVLAFDMQLLGDILGQFISVGFIALIIVFQPEIRQFLLIVGTSRWIRGKKNRKGLFSWMQEINSIQQLDIDEIVDACSNMAKTKTGALIVITRKSELTSYVKSGTAVDSKISSRLLENIFFKNSPLHDGAIIIHTNRIKAASCVLPLTEDPSFPANLGLRHRAASGISEVSDAIAIVVSEQTGNITLCKEGHRLIQASPERLRRKLYEEFLHIADK